MINLKNYTVKFVLVPVRVEVDEQGRIGSLLQPSIADVQARMDAGHSLSRLETAERMLQEHLNTAYICAKKAEHFHKQIETNQLVSLGYGRKSSLADLQKERARFHDMYEHERDQAQALILELRKFWPGYSGSK